MTQLRVAEAEANLRSAKKDHALEQREAARTQLAQTRQARQNAEAELERLTAEIRKRDHAIEIAQSAVDVLTARLTEHAELKPEILELLPEDREARVWKQTYDQLTQAHAQAVARRRQLENDGPSKLEAVRLHDKVVQLGRAERNLIEQLNGTGPGGGWKSSLSRVL